MGDGKDFSPRKRKRSHSETTVSNLGNLVIFRRIFFLFGTQTIHEGDMKYPRGRLPDDLS